MPSRNPNRPGASGDAHERAQALSDYFKTSNASVSGVLDWDIKPDRLRDAVLGMLAAGGGLMFGLTRDGSSMSVTVYLDEGKERKYIDDSIDFDDFMEEVSAISEKIRQDKKLRAERAAARNGKG